MFWCWVSIICLTAEFLIIFFGLTLFNDKYNLMMIGAHVLGLSATNWFSVSVAHYNRMFFLCVIAAIVPLVIESLSLLFSKMNYRKATMV